MIVIDWLPNGQGGFMANVLYNPETHQRFIWSSDADDYVELKDPTK